PEQVLVDLAGGATGDIDGIGDQRDLRAHQGDRRRVHGDVGARPHRDADIARRQCRGVVDAIADHGDHALPLEFADRIDLLARPDVGVHLVDAKALGDTARRAFVVARDHHGPDAEFVQACNGFVRAGTGLVAEGQQALYPDGIAVLAGDPRQGVATALKFLRT